VSATAVPEAATHAVFERPRLLFFHSSTSGHCRRAEGYLAQVLQRRRNHEAFELIRIPVERRPELAARFRVDTVPTLVVVDGRKVAKRVVAPTGCRDLKEALAPWLR
jgi:thioredoxin-like negative regulator of GroEL